MLLQNHGMLQHLLLTPAPTPAPTVRSSARTRQRFVRRGRSIPRVGLASSVLPAFVSHAYSMFTLPSILISTTTRRVLAYVVLYACCNGLTDELCSTCSVLLTSSSQLVLLLLLPLYVVLRTVPWCTHCLALALRAPVDNSFASFASGQKK